MYRKIKDRERQQWKEEMKQRIVQKQKEELTKLLTEGLCPEVPQEPDDSVIEIKIQCVSDSDTNDEVENEVTKIMTRKMSSKIPPKNEKFATINPVNVRNIRSTSQTRMTGVVETPRKPRPTSAPDLSQAVTVRPSRSKSTSSEPTRRQGSPRNPSRCSSRSQAKSCKYFGYLQKKKIIKLVEQTRHRFISFWIHF